MIYLFIQWVRVYYDFFFIRVDSIFLGRWVRFVYPLSHIPLDRVKKERVNNFILFNKKMRIFSHFEICIDNFHRTKSSETMRRCDVKLS
jgi:hypothetical protein